MKTTKIDELKKRYWEGNTSLREEESLRQYYRDNNPTDDPLGALLDYYEQQKSITYDKEILPPKKSTRIFNLRVLMSIAATILLIMTAYWGLNFQKQSPHKIVIEDPQVALELTKQTLALLNGKIDQSSKTIKHGISHLDKTLIFKNN